MGLFGYHDIRTEEQRRAHAVKMLKEKFAANEKDYEKCTEYERSIRRAFFSIADAEIFFQTQLLMERAEFEGYIVFNRFGKTWDMKVDIGEVNWRCGGDGRVLNDADIARNSREFRKLYNQKHNEIKMAEWRGEITETEEYDRMVDECYVTSDMIDKIYDKHRNLVFDRQEFYKKKDQWYKDFVEAESTITDVIIRSEQAEITVIESGRLVYDMCQSPYGGLRGDSRNVPQWIKDAIADDVVNERSKVEVVPGRPYHCDELKHTPGWQKQILTGSVVGKDFDGVEKRFYYTYSAAAQYGVTTKANGNVHDLVDIPFTDLPVEFKQRSIADAFEGAVGVYFDVNKVYTENKAEAIFANIAQTRRIAQWSAKGEEVKKRKDLEDFRKNRDKMSR